MAEERRSLLAPDVPRWPASRGPVLSLKGVRKRYGTTEVLAGIDLEIPTGQTTAVIGASGSGKTVLLKIMGGLLRADAGEVRLFGEDLTTASGPSLVELRKRSAVVFQNYALFDSLSVFNNVSFPLEENSALQPDEIKQRVDELLELLEMDHAADMMPADLSGGMRKRVSLARAVITQPEVVLFDEPTTGLDPVMITFVDEMIRRTQERYQITSVIITHDMISVGRLAHHVAVLDDGRIAERCTPQQLLKSTHPRVRSFLDATSEARSDAPAEAEPSPPTVAFDGVCKAFGSHQVLEGVSFRVPPGEITVVIGGSGSGKSVIIKHMMGLMMADSGRVEVFGQDIATLSSTALQAMRLRIGMVFQQSALLDSLTVGGNVGFALTERGELSRSQVRERVASILERLRIPELIDRFPGDVSTGHRKRVALARALITEPEMMIYDEPTTGQDPVMTRAIDDMIVEANQEFNITSVVISHDMESTFRIAHRVAMLNKGRIIEFGTPAAVRASRHDEVRRFVDARQLDSHGP